MPLLMRTGDGNEADKSVFAKILLEFKKQIEIERKQKEGRKIYFGNKCFGNRKVKPRRNIIKL